MYKERLLLLQYIRDNINRKIDNIEQIIKDIENNYPEDQELYVELANYYINNNDIHNAIKYLEKYKENKGENIDVLILLSKKYIDVNCYKEAKRLLEKLSLNNKINSKQKEEISCLLSIIKVNVVSNTKNTKETKFKIFNDIDKVNYNKDIVYKVFEENKNIEDIVIEIKNILFVYNLNIKDIVIDFLEKILEKNLLHEKLLINFIYNEINENNSIFYNIIDYYKEKKDCFNLIKILCCLIEFDDTYFFVNNELSVLLSEIDDTNKNDIIELLMFFYDNSKRPRAKNIFLNEAEILQQKTILKSKPREIDVTVTFKCNLKCIMCNTIYNNDNYIMDDYIYDFLLHNIKYLEKIVWKGGEVFLYKNFLNLLKLAYDNSVHQIIITNGLLLNEKIIELLCKSNVSLSISIDAVEKELYEKIRVGGQFEVLLKNISLLKKYKKIYPKFSYSMATVLTNINYRTMDDIVDFAFRNEFDGLYFMKCEPTEKNKYLLLNEKDIKYIKDKLIQYQKTKMKIRYDIAFQVLKDNNVCAYEDRNYSDELKNKFKETVFCLLPWKKICLNKDKKVSFDCHCNTIEIEDDDIWNDKEIVEYREKILKNKEYSCKIFLENKK